MLAPLIHFTTYGGNPVSMAAGSAVLDVIDGEGLTSRWTCSTGRWRASKQHKSLFDHGAFWGDLPARRVNSPMPSIDTAVTPWRAGSSLKVRKLLPSTRSRQRARNTS